MPNEPRSDFGVIELRRYALHPGKRDALIELFEREFIESQEEAGMVPVGQYRDLDDVNSFVWFRGFAQMEQRRSALEAFYTSKTWIDNREAANATMVDSDNVLLLRSARPASGFDLRGLARSKDGGQARGAKPFVTATILMLERPADESLIAAFEDVTLPRIRTRAQRIAYFVTEERPNDFPQLPVRKEFTFVVAGICPDKDAVEAWVRAFGASLFPGSLHSVIKSREVLRLEPALRSLYQ
jgi:NIPSNAP protein